MATAPDAADTIDLGQVFRTLWRGKLWIALIAAATLVLGWYQMVYTVAPSFTARTEMAQRVDGQSPFDMDAMIRGFSGDFTTYSTELAVLTSGEMIGRLVDELNLTEDPEFNPFLPGQPGRPGLLSLALDGARDAIGAAIRALRPADPDTSGPLPPPSPEEMRQETIAIVRSLVEVESNYDTYVFVISVTTMDPGKSVLLANTLAQIYRDDQIRTKVETTERMATWLSERVGELRAELDERQNQMAELQASSALVSAESLAALNDQAIDLRSRLAQAENQLALAEQRVTALQDAQASGDRDAAVAAAQDSQLSNAAAIIASGGTDGEIRFDRRLGQILLQSEAELQRAQQLVAGLRQDSDALAAQFEAQSADFQALQQLQQEAAATQTLYETFLTRLKEASVQQDAYEAESRILTAATGARQISPRPVRAMAISLLLGLILGSVVVLVREYRQNTFRTSEDLEQHAGRPVLGQIPRMPTRSRIDTIRYLQSKPSSAAAEAVRNLRTSLLLANVDHPPQVIMTTSSVPAEGKTTIAISLAQNLAGLDKRVLLIEGDIRRRTFDAYFGSSRGKGGLLSVVTGRVSLGDAVIRPDGFGADVLLGEQSKVNAADVFSSASFRNVIEDARSAYDYVIVDTPPVLVVPDARVIAQLVDAVAYVVHWDRTPRFQVDEGLRLLRSVNVPVTGLVLSRIDPKGMRRYGYGGRYGAYSRYGKGYYVS